MRRFIFSILIFSSFISLGQSAEKFEFFLSERTARIPSTYSSADNIYMRDMVVDPPQKIVIELTQKERDEILKKVKSINLFSYPDIYKFESADSTKQAALSQPCTQFNLTIFLNDSSKYVGWNNCHTGVLSKNNIYENLEELRQMIDNFLFSKDSYKKSRTPRAMHY
jgi:hypothetical protein